MSDEREVKLAAPPGFRLPNLDGAIDGMSAAVLDPQLLQTAYLDTPDLRIARWGCGLRHRGGQGWTVKLPPRREGDLLVRAELVFPGEVRRVPEEAVDLLRAYVRSAELGPVAKLRTVRQRVELRGDDSTPLAEVVDDEVSVMDGTRVAARFREVEVELGAAAPSTLLDAVLVRLREAGAGPVSNVPKNVRALGPRASAPPEVEVPDLGREASVGDVVRAALASSVVRLMRHDAGVRIGEDPEDVHQARVASRRMRSDLRTLQGFVDPEWSASLRVDLGRLGGELGAVRDAEVLIQRLRSRLGRLPTEDVRVAERLIGGLERTRAEARSRLLASMRGLAYMDLLDRLVDAARSPALVEELAERPATEVLGAVMERPWQHLRNTVEGLSASSPDEEYHAARIRAKRVRYASEAVAPVFGKPARGFAAAAAALQDALGEHQDAVIAEAWLRQAGIGNAHQSFVAGELAAFERSAADEARGAWPDAWKSLSRKRLKFWS